MEPSSKNDQEFLLSDEIEIYQEIKKSIRKALRSSHKNLTSAIKRISRETTIHERAIRNWYEGHNIPSTCHLIILARTYPAIFHVLLRLTGHEYLTSSVFEKNVPINVPDKYSLDLLNERQKWILFKLALNHKILPRDVGRVWSVAERTAKRDMADLKFRGYVIFLGSLKNGRYILRTAQTDQMHGIPDHFDKCPVQKK